MTDLEQKQPPPGPWSRGSRSRKAGGRDMKKEAWLLNLPDIIGGFLEGGLGA